MNEYLDDFEEEDEDFPINDQEFEESAPTQHEEPEREPVFASLLRSGITKTWGHHPVLLDFVDMIVPHLSARFAHVAAKGGNFVVDKRAEGMPEATIARFRDDQSMRAHLVNGLLPTFRIATQLKAWDSAPMLDAFDENCQRLFCAGYVLHDWVKLPDIEHRLQQLNIKHSDSIINHLPAITALFDELCSTLGIHTFLQSLGTPEDYVHDLIYIAVNTQIRWGTMHNLSKLDQLNRSYTHQRELAKDLSNLADYIAYVGRNPRDLVQHASITKAMHKLSDSHAHFVYHHISEVRGMVTNMINTSAQALCAVPDQRVALLFAPTGTVYLERKTELPVPWPSLDAVAEKTIETIKTSCRTLLSNDLQGFQRDGKGFKYAPFYDLFFTPQQFAELIPKAAQRKLAGKVSAAEKRYSKMLDTTKPMLTETTSAMLPDPASYNWTIDMLAEGLALLEKQLRDYAPSVDDPQQWILEQLGLTELAAEMSEIPQRANTGGVPYQWYFAAGVAHVRHSKRDSEEWHAELARITTAAQVFLASEIHSIKLATLHNYVVQHVRFSHTTIDQEQLKELVVQELKSYQAAHKVRGASRVCSLCSSPYDAEQQREAAVLFAPMVYSNKQQLHSSKATRHICTICEMEMMLRVLLMNRGGATGKNVESQNIRYLFFYPTYFWTAETLEAFHLLVDRLQKFQPRDFRKKVESEVIQQSMINLAPQRLQYLHQTFLASDQLEEGKDTWFRYRSSHAGAFGFIGIKPFGRDSTDTESWVQPTFLALLMPFLLDMKVVASASILPTMNEANEMPETVLFDSPHQWVIRLIGNQRLNLDQLLPALQKVAITYFMHLDANSKPLDSRWNALSAVVRDLDGSPLHVFTALKKYQRKQGYETLPTRLVKLYYEYFSYFENTHQKGQVSMSHARELVEQYRQFYRALRPKTNAILRPISIAASVILEAHPTLFNQEQDAGEALVEVVRGRLTVFVRNIGRNNADGYYPKGSDRASRDAAVAAFSRYFVQNVYLDALNGDPAALRGKQLNLLKNACEIVYLDQHYMAHDGSVSLDDADEADNLETEA